MKMMKCTICRHDIELKYNEEINSTLLRREYCYQCNFWIEVFASIHVLNNTPIQDRKDLKSVWITNEYSVYKIYKHKEGTPKGHSGRKFKAILKDGRVEESDNVWSIGRVPEHLHTMIEPNVIELDMGWGVK